MPLSILLVEDHEDTARVLGRLLQGDGYRVSHARSALHAIQLAGRERFDLVISDLGLPDMTGQDLMRQLKQRHGMTGIAISGYGTEADIARSKEAGFATHLIKPVNLKDLEAAIKCATGGKQQD